MRVHRRQFVVGPEPALLDATWESLEMGHGQHLSWQRSLPVTATTDRDGTVWHLLGIAVQTDPSRRTPVGEIAAGRSDEIEGLSSAWSGRWVLIGRGILVTDAGGTLGCLYARRSGDGKLVISSSAALVGGKVRSIDAAPPLRHGVGMDWYPAPASRFTGVCRLLPSQSLGIEADARSVVKPRPLLGEQVSESYDETLAYLETSLCTALRNLGASGRPLWLALTGGHDSRLLLAVMLREGMDFTTFTFDAPWISQADRFLPSQLARDAGVPHHWITRRRFDEQRLSEFDEHTALSTVDRDRDLYAWGQWDQLPTDAVVIRANFFELGSLHYWAKLPADEDSMAEAIEAAFDYSTHHGNSVAHREGVRGWVDWVHAHPESTIDWRDRFYWEQRGGAWVAGLEQGLDLVGPTSVQPLSCGAMLAAILRIDARRRYAKRWQVDLAYRLAPFVTDHPYSLGGRTTIRLRRATTGWLHHPNRRRFVTGRLRSFASRARASSPRLSV
jgi:hypothetical protein